MKLNKFLQAEDSLFSLRPQFVNNLDFDIGYDVQSKNVKISNLVANSVLATATGSVDTANSVTVTITLTPNAQDNLPNFAVPYVAIYTGTAAVAANQLYPKYGSGIGNAKYQIQSGFDYRTWDGINSKFMVGIENNSGTTTSIFVQANWKVIVYGPGAVTNG